MAKLPWTPWHDVVALRDDLKSGDLPLHLFAADLYDVLMQSGKRPLYEQSEQFFALTFPTYNLRHLVRDVVLRVSGQNDKAVRQLELTYGGGKTHTLITLYHLVHDPDNLPDLPAVHEFKQAIGQKPSRARVVGLCFDKLDVEKGMQLHAPEGNIRTLKHPWSALAYQIAGDQGLKLLHAEGKAEERETAPAENLLTELLAMPAREGLATLVLIDEVLMYAREKASDHSEWRSRLLNFFQYLTQAATKVDRCCIVASLLATDPAKSDSFGRQLIGDIYDIFQRQREVPVEPVVKEDVAEVLRRRFFTAASIKDRNAFRQHVVAALKGITAVDEQTAKQGAAAEERWLQSYPFHPDLTEVLYGKWTNLDRFQRTRGVLRIFALALREAEKWDQSPLIGPAVLLNAPDAADLSEAMRELVAVADTEEHEGKKQVWTPILEGELSRARDIQTDSVGLKYREIEQAVMTTFLNSQPIGQSAKTRELTVLISPTRPDNIELEKGLSRWAQSSHWLDDLYAAVDEGNLPRTWRLGNRPNLTQMQVQAARNMADDRVRARLLDELSRLRKLTEGASASGVRAHMLPANPRDVEDDGAFRYAVLGPSAACDSGRPSPLAKRFLDENTGPDNPRVYRNAVVLVCPSRDGLELAEARVRDYLAWEQVQGELQEQQARGHVDVDRLQTLSSIIQRARGRIPEAIRQAYSTVVTVSDKNDAQAFKLTVTDEAHFSLIKGEKRSRIQDTAITAEALLPDGPYNLWREGETSRRVKDLASAFAQLPHLPKMLKAEAIIDTLVEGCRQGTFVLRLTRPDGSFRTWWRSQPDDAALKDPALELVLPEAAELASVAPELLSPQEFADLWPGDEITVQDVFDYFNGSKVVQIDKGGYQEPRPIPKASPEVVKTAIAAAVEHGQVWLLAEPSSVLGELLPPGVLTPTARLCLPPPMLMPAAIMQENLPSAWQQGETTALAIATGLSQKAGRTLPWKTVKDVVTASLQARFIERVDGSVAWPCEVHEAKSIKLKISSGATGDGVKEDRKEWLRKLFVAHAELEPSEIQDLADAMPRLLTIKAKASTPITFHLQVELGNGQELPSQELAAEFNAVLNEIKQGFQFQ
ncbi:hypothetical protein NKDENANG_01913 [Candidatus Entotheonellaceae bacterium PAL068K]